MYIFVDNKRVIHYTYKCKEQIFSKKARQKQ